MRILPILTAAAIGLAGVSFANAQATNQAPKSGSAQTMSNSESMSKPMGKSSKKMKKSKKKMSKKMTGSSSM